MLRRVSLPLNPVLLIQEIKIHERGESGRICSFGQGDFGDMVGRGREQSFPLLNPLFVLKSEMAGYGRGQRTYREDNNTDRGVSTFWFRYESPLSAAALTAPYWRWKPKSKNHLFFHDDTSPLLALWPTADQVASWLIHSWLSDMVPYLLQSKSFIFPGIPLIYQDMSLVYINLLCSSPVYSWQ